MAFDLTNAKSVLVKIANDDGYIMQQTIDLTTVTSPLGGTLSFPINQNIMNTLVPDDYDIEVWVTMNDGTQAIFPSDGTLGFSIEENLMSDTGEVIPTITLNDFQQQFDDLSSQMENAVHNVQKGDKGDKGDTGQGLEIKDRVSSVSNLPSTANEGDGYLVNEELYIWVNGAWKDCGPIQGPQGIQGIQGKTGTGVSSTTIQYQISNSATTAPTGTWSNTLIATTQVNPFLWTQVTLNYDDGTSKSFYIVSSKGDKGDTGATGQSVWYFQYDIGANGAGRWWSDLKPTPTTDNPPKVGDTIVDLIGNVYQITNVVVGGEGNGGGTFDYGDLLTSIKGTKGDTGPVGAGLAIKGTVSNASQLPTTGNQEGYCYFVGTDLYVWDAGAWKNCGSVSPDLSNYVTVTDLNNGLSAKADTSAIGQLKTDLTNQVSTLQTQVDNSAVGTNLIVQSDLKSGYISRDTGGITDNASNFYSDNYIATNGETVFTLSSPDYIFKGSTNHSLAMYDSDKNYLGYQIITSKTQTLSNSKAAYIKFSLNTTDEGAITGNSSDWLDNHRYKLEKGSVATDWCPNPEDKVNVADMRKPASDVAGIEEVNAKQDKLTITPADDSKVAHLSGANNFDTTPTVNSNPLLLASSLPSDLARLGQDQEYTGKNIFDTAPIDKTTGNPYITKDGVPAVPSTLADTTKLANFTDGLQKGGKDVATTADVTNAVNSATASVVTTNKLANFTAGLQSGGVSVATSDDLKSVEKAAWCQLDNKYIIPASGYTLSPWTSILYKIDDSNNTLCLSGSIALTDFNASNVLVTVQFGSLIKSITASYVAYLGYSSSTTDWDDVTAGQSSTNLTFLVVLGCASIIADKYGTPYILYDKLV